MCRVYGENEIFATLVVSRIVVMPIMRRSFVAAITCDVASLRSACTRRSGDAAEMLRAASKRRRDETIDVRCRQ